MLFLKFTCTNYKKNMAMGRFTTIKFRAVDYAKPARFELYVYIWRVTRTPHQFAFISPLGQGRLVLSQYPFLRSSCLKQQYDTLFMQHL